MGLPRNNNLLKIARLLQLRVTPAERKLWFGFLREYPIPIKTQKVIGPYIVDFFCNKVRLSIELNGSHHYYAEYIKKDEIRTTYLEMLEIKELRFPNSAIWSDFEGVCEVIHSEIQARRNDLVHLPLKELYKKK